MKLIALATIALGVLLLECPSATASPKLGMAVLTPDTAACVTFAGEARRIGDQVLVFLFSPQRIVDGVIRGTTEDPCSKTANPEGQSYSVVLRYPISTDPVEIGIAVYDPSARAEYSNGEFLVRTEGARAPLQFRQCASQEGIHFTAWRGNRRTWHQYWYLGYDLEPNCTDEEIGDRPAARR